MAKYIVEVPEVHIQKVEIEADSPKDAILKVAEGGGLEKGEVEFSYCLDLDEFGVWTEERETSKVDFKKGYDLDL